MNKKQIFIVLCLFIISILAVSAVSATENADDLNMSMAANGIMQVSNTQEDLLTDTAGTFTQLNDKIQDPSAIITLDKNYTYTIGDANLSSGITISNDITIDGAGYTIDGAHQASIFNICEGSHVVLKNINFVNANGTADGAALKWTPVDYVEIFNCNFINNSAFGDGGAIYINDTSSSITSTSTIPEYSFNIVNSTFTNNIAGDDGGAIYANKVSGIIYNITCINNKGVSISKPDGSTSSTRGGAICLTGDNVIISKSSFTSSYAFMDEGKNSSKVDGGALFITGDNVHVIDTTFDDCSATNHAGAIYIIGNNTLVDNCTFDSCTANNCSGAIYVQGSAALINNSVFTNNIATLDGGCIYVEGNGAKLYNSEFINNTAGDDGGAIHWEGNNGIIYNITCINNKGISNDDSNSRGGTICLTGDDVIVTKSTFTHSSVSIDSSRSHNKTDGGALFITGNNVNITYTTFNDCNATQSGGALYIIGNNTKILDCTIEECNAEEGGSISIEGHDAHILQSNITNSFAFYAGGVYVNGPNTVISANFVNCTATGLLNEFLGSGGSIYINGENTNIIQSTFFNSVAFDGDGGAIYINGINTTVQESDFKFTSADNNKGGAIYIAGNNAHVLDSTFSKTHADYGGAVYIGGPIGVGNDAKVLDCNISSSTSDFDGGAIYVAGNHAIVSANIKDTKALGLNPGKGNGGAIYVDGSNSTITASTFENCSAGLESAGGAIYINGPDANVEKSIFHNTYAINGSDNATGGAIAIVGEFATVSDSNFTECHAYKGGVISVEGRQAKVLSSHMTDSSAYDIGGAIYIDGPNTEIKDSEFMDCSALSENAAGGAIYIKGKKTNIAHSTFDSCVSVDGGAVYINGADASISGSEFISNKLVDYSNDDNYGGAIYVNGTNANIVGSTFNNHSAFIGGAIYINGTGTTVSGSNFALSTADCGGAIYVNGAEARIVGSTFDNCNAIEDGGSIYVAGLNTGVDKSKFSNSYARNGGAITIVGAFATVSESVFEDTHAQNGVGGAIDIIGVNAVIEDSNFTDSNSSAGGAIYVSGDDAAICGSHFSNSLSNTSGGAIYVKGANTKISDDTFDSCHSLDNGTYVGGGAIYVAGDGTHISESEFAHSTSANNGGAIYVAGKNTIITTSTFTSNRAEKSAGAIYISKYNETVNGRRVIREAQNTTIEDCSFNDNTAKVSGGAVRVSGTNTTINRSNFIQNKLTYKGGVNDQNGVGGALYIDGINATVQYSSFTKNTCNSKGGAVYWYGGHGGDSIIGCNFTKNKASSTDYALGGGVYWSVGDSYTPGGLVKDSIFDSNYAGKHGGGMDWYQSHDSVMDNCTFINNSAYKDGGGFYIGDTGGNSINMTVTNCKFINNTAGYAGGAISVQMSESHFINSTFDGNEAVFGGSVIIKDGFTVNTEIRGCTFTNSLAKNNTKSEAQVIGKGGAIFARDNSISVDNCTFINCTAHDDGGAIYWDGGINYDSSKNPNNLCTADKGRKKYLGVDGVVSNSRFINNTAGDDGGAIYWQGVNGTIFNSEFTGNNATDGGALYWEGGVEYKNVGWNYPKSFVVRGDNGKVYNLTFTENTAVHNGGAVYWAGTNGTIDNSSFRDNVANKGGAVYWNNITQTAVQGKVSKTVSSGQNGLISNSSFFNNHAVGSDAQGGALYWNTSSSNVVGADFKNNTARLGGAVYWANGESIANSSFRYNKAVNGSAMYVDESTPEMDIVNSVFLENRANSNRFDPLNYTVDGVNKSVNLTVYFRGNDNIINAIYDAGADNVYFTNVTHLGEDDGVLNTGVVRIAPEVIDVPQDSGKFYQTNCEAYQTVVVGLYNANNQALMEERVMKTDGEGKISFYDLDVDFKSLRIKLVHPEDNYYTQLKQGVGANLTRILIATHDVECKGNEVINITVIPDDDSIMLAPTGNITLWIEGVVDPITVVLNNTEGSRCATATVIVPGLNVGEYVACARYNGDEYFMPSDNESGFKVLALADDIIVNTTDIYVGQVEPILITVYPSDKVTGNVSVFLESFDKKISRYLGVHELHNGIVELYESDLPAGEYRVNATYLGDANFNEVRNSSTFKVLKHAPEFVVHADNIFVYDHGVVWVDLPENATGFVLIRVNGLQYYIYLDNSSRISIEQFLVNGTYRVEGCYLGDDYWDSVDNFTIFDVYKRNITLEVQTADIVYGQTEMLNVTLQFKNATGVVNVRVNGTEFNDVPVVNGVARVNVSGLVPGEYVVDVDYPGDNQYNGNVTSGSFIVGKAHIPIKVVPENFTFDKTGRAYIYVNTTGMVNATIEGKAPGKPLELEDGMVYYNLMDLVPGNYTIYAHFSGNEYYYDEDAQADFEVYKLNRTVDISVYDIVYGNYEHVKVYVNASGNVVIFANGENATRGLKIDHDVGHNAAVNGMAEYDISGLPVDTYPVRVVYEGNEYYNPASAEAQFRVIPANTTLDVSVEDIKVWDDEYLNVTVSSNGTVLSDLSGIITIYIDGVNYSAEIKDGVARFVISNLTVGDKFVWAFYGGDRNHNGSYSMAKFNVAPRVPVVNVTGQNIDVGQTEVIHIEIPANATGYVIVTGNFTRYQFIAEDFIGGEEDLPFDNLAPGIYSVHITYYGGGLDNYTVAEADDVFEVSYLDTPVDVAVESIFYKEIANITVSVNDGATGSIAINIVNESGVIRHNDLVIVDGRVNWLVDNLAVDNYTVYAYYSGDGSYAPNDGNAGFEVKKIAPTLIIDSVEANTARNATVRVHITPGTTGNVTINVNGKNYSSTIVNGVVEFVIDQLNSGNYSVVAYYPGDRNFTDAVNSTDDAVVVYKFKCYDLNVSAVDTKVGVNTTITVNVPVDGEGEAAIYVNGTFVGNAVVNNGVAVLTNVTWNVSGPYVVVASFGDDKYALKNTTTRYFVSMWDTPIVISVDDIVYVGDVVKIVVSVPVDVKDNVTIEIDGKSYTNVTFEGNAVFYVSDLIYGDKTVVATYPGDNKYVFNSTTANFTVLRYDSIITVDGININVGDVEFIDVTLSDNITGCVLVDVDGQGYYVNVTDGVGRLEVSGLAGGLYNVTATYLGDYKYNGAKANNTFLVSKVPSSVTVGAEDIIVGDKEIIEVCVPVDATGVVIVSVDGKMYDVYVANGTGILVVHDLKVGNYSVGVRYPGDRKYESSENSTRFKVSSKDSEIFVVDKGNSTVEIIIGDNATGEVIVSVEGKNFTGEVVNGTALVVVENLTPGVHNITVIYSGDENHTGGIVNGTVTVPDNETHENTVIEVHENTVIEVHENTVIEVVEIPVPVSKSEVIIDVGAYDIYVGDIELINVTLSDNATGVVFIEVNGLVYEPVDVVGNVVRFAVENLSAGGKTVVAYYSGDDEYGARNVTDRFNVFKRDSIVSAEIEDVYVGDDVVVFVKVLDDATGQVLIDIDGVTYYANVSDGVGSVVIPRMLSGTYPVNLTYVGDDKYLPSYNTALFNVFKVPSFVIPIAEDIYVGELENILLRVPADAVGNVTLVIDGELYVFDLAEGVLAASYVAGEKYTVAVSGGDGVLVVSGLPEGEYVVSARYNGDDKYLPSVNDTTFIVSVVYVPEIVHEDDPVSDLESPVNGTEEPVSYVDTEDYMVPVDDDVNAKHFDGNKNKTEAEEPEEPVIEEPVIEEPVFEDVVDAPVSVDSHDIYVGETETVVVSVPVDATGSVTIEIDGVRYSSSDIVDGKATFNVDGLTAGDKTVVVVYSGDDKYPGNSTSGHFVVYKLPSAVDATGEDIDVGDDEIIEIVVPVDATGTVTVEIDGVRYSSSDIVDGKATIVVPGLSVGVYSAKVFYSGDDKYLPSNGTFAFEVSDVETPIDDDDVSEPEDDAVIDEDEDDDVPSDVPSDGVSGDVTPVEKRADGSHVGGDVGLSKYETGNPILVLLLMLFVVGSSQIRRFK